MYSPLRPLVALAALAALGCSGNATDPLAPPIDSSAAAALGQAIVRGDLATSALAIYTVEIDPATFAATSRMKADRSAQATDDLYLLPIDAFLKPDSFTIKEIGSTPETIDITYDLAHPFAAPTNLDGPITAANRADLGVAAMVLFLADVPSATGNTYFTDVVANTELVANPDAFYAPGDLIQLGTTANTFPFKLAVDEGLGPDGNRLLIGNGGDPTGDYGADGWTRAEIGQFNDDWTGYGVLHQGQIARNTVALDRTQLASAAFTFDVAIIAKYNDPRGGVTASEKKANRLPPVDPDYTRFAYRMPHGALDVQKVTFEGSSNPYFTGSITTSDLRFHVEDWDARSSATTELDLSADPVLTNVAPGEPGTPELAVSIPGVIGDTTTVATFIDPVADDDSLHGGDVGVDSGHPRDGLFYEEAVASQATGPALPGDYTGLVRVTDPEVANIGDPAFILELDGTLTPISGDIPEPVTYQAFTVSAEAPPSLNGWAVHFGSPTDSDDADDVVVDSLGNVIVSGAIRGTADFGGGPRTSNGGWDPFVLKLDPNGEYLWDKTFGGSDCCYDERVEAIAVDAAGNIYATGWWKGTANFGGGPRTGSTSGSSNTFMIKYDPSGAYQWDKVFGTASSSTEANGIDVDPAGGIHLAGFIGGTADFGGGVLTSAGSWDIFAAKFDNNGNHSWSKRFGSSSISAIDLGYDVVADQFGNSYVTGFYSGTIDWGVGPVSNFGSFDGFLLKLNSATGAYLWDKTFRGSAADAGWAVDTDSADVVVGGYMRTSVTFGGPVRTVTDAGAWVAKYSQSGTYLWDKVFDSTLGDFTRDVDVDPSGGAVVISGEYRNTVNFGGGPRTSAGGADAFAVRLDTTGAYVWDAVWPNIDTIHSLAIHPTAGDPYFVGEFSGTKDFDPHPVNVFNMPSNGFEDVYVMKLLRDTGTF